MPPVLPEAWYWIWSVLPSTFAATQLREDGRREGGARIGAGREGLEQRQEGGTVLNRVMRGLQKHLQTG